MGVVVVDGSALARGDTLDTLVGKDGHTLQGHADNLTLVSFTQHITEVALPREQSLMRFGINIENKIIIYVLQHPRNHERGGN